METTEAMGLSLTEPNEEDKVDRVDSRHLDFVTIDGVNARDMFGNIFVTYAILSRQGVNTIFIFAADGSGNVGTDAVTVILDDTRPVTLTVDSIPALVFECIFIVIG